MIPVFIVEEHHEAFFIWNYAILKQIIAEDRYALLHVDDHADMYLPILQTSLKKVRDNMQHLFLFMRNQLSISDFILPAVYQGLFNEIYWMRWGQKLLSTEYYLNVFSHKGEGQRLLLTDNFLQAGVFNPDRKAAVFRQIDNKQSISPTAPVILDIDLDYFLCDHYAGEAWEVQVTEHEYRAFTNDAYHRLRIKFGGRLQPQMREGNYYLVYHPPVVQHQPGMQEENVAERLGSFARWLREQNIQPVLIDICRSHFSGYTPPEQWQWMEDRLLKTLSECFSLTIKYIRDLFHEESLLDII